jgi:hypothetical protein
VHETSRRTTEYSWDHVLNKCSVSVNRFVRIWCVSVCVCVCVCVCVYIHPVVAIFLEGGTDRMSRNVDN